MRRETQKSFYTESGTINTAMHGGLLYILLHPLEYSCIYNTGISANQIHLSYTHIFCNVKQIRFLYQISQFLRIKLSTRSHVLRTAVYQNMLTEIEVKCMNMYPNENASSKYLMFSTNDRLSAVSHYVSVCKIAFGCVHNMPFLNFTQAMYVILSPP